MNSLAGIVYPDTYQNTQKVSQMLSFVDYRVPTTTRELKGIFQHKNIELGVCGKTEEQGEIGKYQVGIDGTIFNLSALQIELHKKGYPQQIIEPEAVLAAAYAEWGTHFLEKIEGDFALFIFDRDEETLLLARDRIGKKPLYWAEEQGHLLFCSSLKGILATGIVPQTPDKIALAAYFSLGYFPQDTTPIQKVNKLLPGHYLLFKEDRSMTINPYWSYSAQFEKGKSEPKISVSNELDRLLNLATKKNLPQKGETIATILSGGPGTSSITYYLHQNVNHRQLDAFTAYFKMESERDLAITRVVAETLKIAQYVTELTPENFLNDFSAILWYLDEPIADPNVVAYWNLARAASEYSSFLFSGMGCDEILAAHRRYSQEEQPFGYVIDFQSKLRGWITDYVVPLANKIYSPWAYSLLKHSRKNIWQIEYFRAHALLSPSKMEEVCPGLAKLFDPEVFISKFYNLPEATEPVTSYIYYDVKTSLPDLYILQVERMTSAFALEWHTPFLDKAVVEFAASIPFAKSMSEAEAGSPLKEILRRVFPSAVVEETKRKRVDFLKNWIENSELEKLFQELSHGTLVGIGIVNSEWLKGAIKTVESRRENFHILWLILVLEVWFRIYVNNPIPSTPPGTPIRDLLQEDYQ